MLSAPAREVEGDLRDARDLFHAVFFGVIGELAAFADPSAALAEVDAADQLAHDHEVDALFGDVFAERAGPRERGEEPGGAQVGIKPQRRADLQKSRLGAQVPGQLFDALVAHGAAHRA